MRVICYSLDSRHHQIQTNTKQARVTGLAIAIVGGGEGVPAFLAKKRVLSLDMGLLIAGAKERGELELRVTRLLQETRDAGDVILMCGSLDYQGQKRIAAQMHGLSSAHSKLLNTAQVDRQCRSVLAAVS